MARRFFLISSGGVNPPIPCFETIRWHGMTSGVGFRAMAWPTALGEVPTISAISP